jgi:hypothetical protein
VDGVTADLGIPPDAGPEQAAADEAAKSAAGDAEALDRDAQEGASARAEAQNLDLTDAQEDPPEAGAEETQPDQPVEDQDANVVALSPRMMQQLTPQETPAPRQSKKQKAEEAQAAKIALKTQSPSTKRLGPLSSKVPGAEHIKIHKRAEDGMPGKRAYVGDYDVYDLSQSQDLETFIARYIKPKWGAGEYQVTGVDAKGQEFDAGVIKLIDPVKEEKPPQPQQQGTTAMDLLQLLLQERMNRDQEASRGRPRETPPVNPVQQLGEIFDLQQRVGESTKKENEGAFGAIVQAMSQQTNVMMQMMMANQAKGEERMAMLLETLGKPKEIDPTLGILLTKLFEEKSGGNLPPPPPPPPPKNPVEDLKTLAEAMALMKGNDDKLLGYIMNREDKEKLGVKEILELVKNNVTAPGTDDFKRSMENLTLMMQAAQSLRQATEGGPATGFWEFAQALVSNQDLAGTIGQAIRTRQGAQMPRGPMQQGRYPAITSDAVAAEEAQLARQIENTRQKRLLLLRRELQAEKEGLQEATVNDTARHRPVIVNDEDDVPAPVSEIKAPGQQPRMADQEDMQAVERERTRRGGKIPQMPPDIAEHLNALVLSQDDADVVENIVRMLQYLAELEDWQQFAELQLEHLKTQQKEKFLALMGGFFDGLIKIGYMDEQLKVSVLGVLENNFTVFSEEIVNELGDDEESEEEPEEEPEESSEE